MTTGTATLPAVMATPMSTVPTRAVANPSEERSSVPASTVTRDAATTRPVPSRPSSTAMSGVARAKHRTGMPVSRPTLAALRPRSARTSSTTGASAVIGARRFRAYSRTAASRSPRAADRAAVMPSRRVERRGHLAQQIGEPVAVRLVQVAQEAALDVEQVGERRVDPGQPDRGELHQHAAAVVGSRLPLHQAVLRETVDAVGHRAAGDQRL